MARKSPSLNVCLVKQSINSMYKNILRKHTNASGTQYNAHTVYPKKYAHGFCFAVLCCGYTLTDFSMSIRLTSLALWQSNDCPSASKATLMNMDKYFMWIHYEQLRNHNKAKHNKTVCIFLGIYCNTMDSHRHLMGTEFGVQYTHSLETCNWTDSLNSLISTARHTHLEKKYDSLYWIIDIHVLENIQITSYWLY